MPLIGLSVIIFGLTSAISWGAGDFSGGLASKRTSAYTVVVGSQFVSLALLVLVAILVPERSLTGQDIFLSGIAGIFGAAGLVALYAGLARGPMGLVAPVTAVVGAIVPVVVSLFKEGLPEIWVIFGFAFALAAVWMISQGNSGSKFTFADLRLPIFSGLGFGIFYVLIGQVSENAILWSLVSARSASIIVILGIGLLTRAIEKPGLNQIPIIALAGIFDTSGNVFYALATRLGRLDIAAILSSLYPAVTVLLAWIILKERLSQRQWVSVLLALVALILITL